MSAVDIRDATMADEPAWRRMWSANCAHFGASLAAAEVSELWCRILDPEHSVGALISFASDIESRPMGFAHYVLHPHTFSSAMICYLEDLWVEPSARRLGVGRRLIEALPLSSFHHLEVREVA